jgi:hypothetical protein
MKTSSKYFHFHLPELHIHINPIYRDIVAIAALGLLVAIAAFTLLVMVVSKF